MQRLRVDANWHGYGGKFHLRGAWASEMKFAGTWSLLENENVPGK